MSLSDLFKRPSKKVKRFGLGPGEVRRIGIQVGDEKSTLHDAARYCSRGLPVELRDRHENVLGEAHTEQEVYHLMLGPWLAGERAFVVVKK